MKTITLKTTSPLRSRRNRRLINRLLRAGFTLRLAREAEAARFDRR
jgi:hypothetical protein